ncbi:MAG: polysaccharide biosynthesis tyrosine autokinase [Planctomycetota bacterium]
MEQQHPLEHGEINLIDYLRVIYERKWYVIMAVVVVMTLGIIYSLNATPVYRSTAEIEISPYISSFYDTDEFYRTPRNSYEYAQYSKTRIADLASILFGDRVREILARKHGRKGYATEELLAMISAEPKPDTFKWNISSEGVRRDDLPVILNVVIRVFMEDNVAKRQEASRLIIANIRKEIEDLEAERLKHSGDLLRLKREAIQNDDVFLSPTVNDEAALKLAAINKDLEDTARTVQQIETIMAQFEGSKVTGLSVPSSLDDLHWPAIENQKKDYFTAFESMEEKYGANHPRLNKSRAALASMMKSMEETIRCELVLQQAKAERLRAEKDEQYRRIRNLEVLFPPFKAVFDRIESVGKKLEASEQDLLKYSPSMWDTSNNISITNAASEAVQVKPRLFVNIALAFILGCLAGTGLAFLREYVDRSIKTTRHFEQIFERPVIAILPFIKKDDGPREAVVHNHDTSIHADVFRLLRTKLVYFNEETPGLKVFMVTSPSPNEGKTLVSINLAFSFEKTDRRILLVDADLWKPGIRRVFQSLDANLASTGPGLSNILEGDARIEDVVHVFNPGKDSFHILFAGDSRHAPSEVIAPERFRHFVESIKSRYDFVIIDTPSINEKADGAIMASCVDGVLVIAKRGATSWEAAGNARRILGDVQVNVMGGILNITAAGRHYGAYNMYQNYYYHHKT